jgi:TRAP-type mannitol/chloroaromatic compound transport system permease large subunit
MSQSSEVAGQVAQEIVDSLAPKDITIMDIYKGVIPFVIIKIIVLGLCIIFPWILTYLPSLMK